MRKALIIAASVILLLIAVGIFLFTPNDAAITGSKRLYDCTGLTSASEVGSLSELKYLDLETDIKIEKNSLSIKNVSGTVTISGEKFIASFVEFKDDSYIILLNRENYPRAQNIFLTVSADLNYLKLHYDYDNNTSGNELYGPAATADDLTVALKYFAK